MTLKTPIIPTKQSFVGEQQTLDYKAICVFSALGFFLDDDTYYLEQKALRPATNCQIENENIISQKPYFHWHYNPIERPLQHIVQEFAQLFEQIIDEQTTNQKVILPLSGGLDSRTQAAALKYLNKEVNSYSYRFHNGHDETLYAKKIAEVCRFSFQSLEVPNGYLWNVIDDLAQINSCYAEFTHPRQMAFSGKYKAMGGMFSLGHWGDVLFDDMGVADDLPFEQQVAVLMKKMVKKGGIELATSLWEQWHLEGNFYDYLYERLKVLLHKVNIPQNANAQIRAFKSLYWAPRWTSVNLSIFENERPISLPYFDDRMCEFICSVPEKHLAGRQIQIEYLKMRNPQLARITWQSQKPFNLYNYQYNKLPYNLPYRFWNKTKRSFSTKPYIQRNWELQFLGAENEKQLKERLFQNQKMTDVVSEKLIREFYQKFKNETAVYHSHSVSILLTLSQFFKEKIKHISM